MRKLHRIGERMAESEGLPPNIVDIIGRIHDQVEADYREAFIEQQQTITKMAASLERIQQTLHVLVEAIRPDIMAKVPPVLRIAAASEAADVASAVVVADPLGAGFTLSGRAVAQAINANEADVSILLRGLGLSTDRTYAVVVRQYGPHPVVNYRPEVVDRLRQLITAPPADASAAVKTAVERVKLRWQGLRPSGKAKRPG